jgi:hypothetical protein
MSNFLQEQDKPSQCKAKHPQNTPRGVYTPKTVEHQNIYKYLNIYLLVFTSELNTLPLQKTPFPRSKCKVEKIEQSRTLEQTFLHKKPAQLLDSNVKLCYTIGELGMKQYAVPT